MEGCQYRSIHQELMRDLLRLSTSTYSQVSSREQESPNSVITHSLQHIRTLTENYKSSLMLITIPSSQVRSKAQNVLFTALGTYNFCCRDLIPHVLKFLDPDNGSVTQQQFKVRRLSQSDEIRVAFPSAGGGSGCDGFLCLSRVPYTASWATTAACAWPTCTTGSASP